MNILTRKIYGHLGQEGSCESSAAALEGVGGDGPASRSCPGGNGTPPGFVTLPGEATVLSPFLQAGSWGSPATARREPWW